MVAVRGGSSSLLLLQGCVVVLPVDMAVVRAQAGLADASPVPPAAIQDSSPPDLADH